MAIPPAAIRQTLRANRKEDVSQRATAMAGAVRCETLRRWELYCAAAAGESSWGYDGGGQRGM